MAVDAYGDITGVSVGQAYITAYFDNVIVMTGQMCGGYSCPNNSPAPQAPAAVTPKILLGGSNGTDITGTTQSVVVGQQIILYGSYSLPSGVSANYYSWSVPGSTSNPPTAIGNFVIDANSGTGSTTSVPVTQQQPTFYFVAPGNSQTVSFTLGYGNNQSASAGATFNVVGPTSVSVSTPLGQWQINSNSSGFELDFGFPLPPDQGIQFNGQATSPSGHAGTYEWAQLIGSDNITVTAGSQTLSCTAGTGLDNQFPYTTGLSAADSPSLSLPSADSKITSSDTYTMYFMWRPGLTGDIPVPLGYVTWQIYGDAVQSGATWTVQADSTRSANSFQQSASYPVWTSKVTNSSPLTCH
jgi:hypothetical protein